MMRHEIRGSAKIIEFPKGGRAGLDRNRVEIKPAGDHAMPGMAKASFGGAWYHEEAIQDADRGHNH